jgi:hypothetical protein
MYKIRFYVLGFLAALTFIACQKEVIEQEPLTPSNPNSNNSNNNPRLSYGDTLFFLKNQPGNYTVLPVSKPNVTGYFKSIPLGLNLDSATGRINFTQSTSGIRYKIYYLSLASNLPIDSVKIVLSGIDYADGIYEIARTANAYDTAFPIYNARPPLKLPCGDDDEDNDGDIDDDDNDCVFDETDLDDDGNDDIAGVIQDKLLVDIKKGTIDVEASYHAGVFGSSSNVANGVTKNFTFYYRLQDASNRALQKIDVRLIHYKRRSDIPASVLAELGSRADYLNLVNARTIEESSRILSFKAKRPPLILVVSSY